MHDLAPTTNSGLTIPARIVVGVTGHRALHNEADLREQVSRVLDRLERLLARPRTPVVFTILSPLAEGADRLVARAVLERRDAQLEVVLPLEKADYLHDFDSPNSRTEFATLLDSARHVRTLPPRASRTEAYAAVGRYVIDHCDVLIALWNGQPAAGEGGTAEIISYAREHFCPVFRIDSTSGTLKLEPKDVELQIEQFQMLSRYNEERIDVHRVREQVEKKARDFLQSAKIAGCYGDQIAQVAARLLPHYVKADSLALKYQARYMKAGMLSYACAAAAVGVVAFQALFFLSSQRLYCSRCC